MKPEVSTSPSRCPSCGEFQVLGHVLGVLLPVVGPTVLLAVSARRPPLERLHVLASILFSGMWIVSVVAIISFDVGRLSLDEQETSTGGLVLLLLAAGSMIATATVNIRRAKQQKPPLLLRGRATREG